jgi:hypothetical protein
MTRVVDLETKLLMSLSRPVFAFFDRAEITKSASRPDWLDLTNRQGSRIRAR